MKDMTTIMAGASEGGLSKLLCFPSGGDPAGMRQGSVKEDMVRLGLLGQSV